MGRFEDLLASLGPGARLRRGRPASAAELEALGGGVRLDPTYVAFVAEVGAAAVETGLPGMMGDLRFLGHAPGDATLDAAAAATAIGAEFDAWRQPRVPVWPVLVFGVEAGAAGAPGSECVVLHEGALHHFRRGTLERSGESFEALLERWVDEVREALEAAEERAAFQAGFLGAVAALVPPELRVPAGATGGPLVLVRPADGVEVEVRFGDGRELGGKAGSEGVFASWREDGAGDPEALDAWNARAAFVRGAPERSQRRFRGCLPARGLAPARFLAALAHDAALPIDAAPPPPPSLTEVAGKLNAAPPLSPEERLLWAMFRRTGPEPGAPPAFTADGDALVGRSQTGQGARGAIDVRVRVSALGLVEVAHVRPLRGTREAARDAAAKVNGFSGMAVNLDQEPMVRAHVAEDGIVLTAVTTLAAIGTPVFLQQLRELERAAAFGG